MRIELLALSFKLSNCERGQGYGEIPVQELLPALLSRRTHRVGIRLHFAFVARRYADLLLALQPIHRDTHNQRSGPIASDNLVRHSLVQR